MAWEEAEGSQETLDGVGGSHLAGLGLNDSRVALVLPELIEPDQVPAGAVQKEAEELVEESGHGKPFGAFAHRAKKPIDVGKDLDGPQVAAEESQATPAG